MAVSVDKEILKEEEISGAKLTKDVNKQGLSHFLWDKLVHI